MIRTAAPDVMDSRRARPVRGLIRCARWGAHDGVGNRSFFGPYTHCDIVGAAAERIETLGIGHKFEYGVTNHGGLAAFDQAGPKSNAVGSSVAFHSGV